MCDSEDEGRRETSPPPPHDPRGDEWPDDGRLSAAIRRPHMAAWGSPLVSAAPAVLTTTSPPPRMAGPAKKRSFVETLHVLFAAPDEKGEKAESRRLKDVLRGLLVRKDSWCQDLLRARLPAASWLPRYALEDLPRDFLAGVAVGFTTVPQSIAYAVVARLPAHYGLYSAIMGPFLYLLLGGSKDVTIGPTAILSLMTGSFVAGRGPEYAVLLTFLCGCAIFAMGLLRMGFLMDFISSPVTAGFTSAAAVTIGSTQLGSLLGYGGRSDSFVGAWQELVSKARETSPWDAALGVATIAVLLLTRKLKDSTKTAGGGGDEVGRARRVLGAALWLLSVGRNALVIVGGAALALVLDLHGVRPFSLTGNITAGFPPLQPPPFSATSDGKEENFLDMAADLGPGVLVVSLIAVLESMTVAKVFAQGKQLDVTQEMLALGVVNLAGSFVGSMPVTGSFSRTAVNNASGVRTPLGGLFTGLLILLTLGLLTDFIAFIPKASLSAVIISAMLFLVEYRMVPLLWRTRKLDLVPFFATFAGCLFLSLDYGILVGALIDVSYILYKSARPSMHVKRLKAGSQDMMLVRMEQGLTYPSAEFFRRAILDRCAPGEEGPLPVVVDGTHIYTIDSTVAKSLKLLKEDLEKRDQPVIFWNWRGSAQTICQGLDPVMRFNFRYGHTVHDLFEDTNETYRHILNTKNAFLEVPVIS
ncbi:sodium-independent sulfate anion transporter-like [Bacillus rossius redtenbacheri]|uniref:sodium-independent sulfate anion transporter-like n=1 Tax=Bacillus rossius redtenbacheri TaxID=93214 RepID=UPI002FDDE1A9